MRDTAASHAPGPSRATARLRARIAVLLADPGVAERVRRRLAGREPDTEPVRLSAVEALIASLQAETPVPQEAEDERLEHFAL